MTPPEVTVAWDLCSCAAPVPLCHLQASHNLVFCTGWAFSVTPTNKKHLVQDRWNQAAWKFLLLFFATSHPANPHPYSCKHVPRSRELSLDPPRQLSPPAWATIHLCPLFWTASLDPAVGEDVLHFPSHRFSHQADKILSLHPFSCAKPEKVLKFKHKAWTGKVLSTFWAWVSSITWGKSPWPPTRWGQTHSMRCMNTRTCLHSTQSFLTQLKHIHT